MTERYTATPNHTKFELYRDRNCGNLYYTKTFENKECQTDRNIIFTKEDKEPSISKEGYGYKLFTSLENCQKGIYETFTVTNQQDVCVPETFHGISWRNKVENNMFVTYTYYQNIRCEGTPRIERKEMSKCLQSTFNSRFYQMYLK